MHTIATTYPAMDDDDTRTPIVNWQDSERVFCMAVTPSGRLMTAGAQTGDITLWDSRIGTKEHDLTGHSDSVLALCYVHELLALFSASADSTVRMWSLDTLQNVMVFEGHGGYVVGLFVMVTDSGTGLFSGSDDRTIKQWNINSGACVHTYKGHKGPVNAMACTPSYLYSGSSDGLVKVWDIVTRRSVRSVEAHEEAIWSISLCDNDHIVTGSSDCLIRIWATFFSVEKPVPIAEFREHQGKVRRLLPFGPILFSGGQDQQIHVWNMDTQQHITTLRFHQKQVTSFTLHNNQLCSGGFDRQIARWDVSDLLSKLQPHDNFVPLSALRLKDMDQNRSSNNTKSNEINYLRNKKKVQEKNAQEVSNMYRELPINFLASVLEVKIASSQLSMEVLLYVPFLICFVFLFLGNRPVEENFYMVSGVSNVLVREPLPSFKIDRTFAQVTNVYWFYQFVELLLTNLWTDRSEGYFPSIHGQNLLLGAVRIRTQRVTSTSCTINPHWIGNETLITSSAQPMYSGGGSIRCYGSLSEKTLGTSTFVCPPSSSCTNHTAHELESLGLGSKKGFPFSDNVGIGIAAQLRTYTKGGQWYDLHFNESLAEVHRRVKLLKKLGFIDDIATRLVDSSFYAKLIVLR